MKDAVELSKKISKNLDKNWMPDFEDINLHKIFAPIFSLNHNIITINSICCYIIFAYDNDSSWLNLKQDRLENKTRIANSLNADTKIFQDIIENGNELVNDVIAEYLTSQATWKWQHIMSQLDYYINTMKFVKQKTEEEKTIEKMNKDGEVKSITSEYEIDTLAKVNKLKGELLKSALEAREDADRLLNEVKKEFVQLEHAVQGDFAFSITEEKNINPESWRDFIKVTLPKMKEKKATVK